MVRWLTILLGVLAVAVALPGCGPAVPNSELGEKVYEVPKVPGADEPYPIPEVVPPLSKREPDL